MRKNITYLLGAGASYNALPVLNQMEESMIYLKSKLESGDFRSEYKYNVIEDINWILKESSDFFTVDTLAKTFFVQNRFSELERLKRGLSAFFILEQFRNKSDDFPSRDSKVIKNTSIDLRYINFLASITLETNRIHELIQLPENLNIITWNYDIQLELAFARFLKRENDAMSLEEIFTRNVPSHPCLYAYRDKDEENNPSPKIIHLNGAAGLYSNKNKKHVLNFVGTLNNAESGDPTLVTQCLESQISKLYKDDTSFEQGVTYAWEKTVHAQQAVGLARDIMYKTDILVVIGYSFPFFNREVDRDLFGFFVDKPRGSEPIIYFQDPNEEAYKSLYDKFDLSGLASKERIKVIPITSVNQFHLPFEL